MAFTSRNRIGCQICLENFHNVRKFKLHVRGREHLDEMEEVFPKDKCKRLGHLCSINVMEYVAKPEQKRPILGLSMVTVCPNSDLGILFYLCHLCEQTCTQGNIMSHLFSHGHYINYFNYTDPDVLSFSWLPNMKIMEELKHVVIKDIKKNGNGVLQVLDLPQNVFEVIRRLTYAKAMTTLEKHDKLALKFKESMPQRISMQSYVAEPRRKHVLLGLYTPTEHTIGLQHLVCVCDGLSSKRLYLCTLCQITLRGNGIINHVISFDHVHRYINAWHPSTLKSKPCYTDYNIHFESMMCSYAKQAEEMCRTDNNIKQVTVMPDVFNSLLQFVASYSKALDMLETISRECDGRSLITTVQPGDPLNEQLCSFAKQPDWKLHCQNCKLDLPLPGFTKHLSDQHHADKRRDIFCSAVEAAFEDDQKVHTPNLKLCSMPNKFIGLVFIVVCICSEGRKIVGSFYMCFACRGCFLDTEILAHMHSHSHALYTVLQQQRMPFAWDNKMDMWTLRQLALKKQVARDRILKVFDIPYCIISKLKMNFFKLTRGQKLSNDALQYLRNDVPCTPNLKPGYPLLGQDFVVRYTVMQNSKEWGFLCLLCGRNLGETESAAHVISYEHAKNFLERAHCGSLDCGNVSRETLLDLAKQAAKIHPVSEIQTMDLKVPILDSEEYLTVVQKLQLCNCELIPVLTPGKKLFPTETLQEVDQGHTKEKTQAESKKTTTESGKSAVKECHSTSHTPPPPSRPKIEPNSPTETTGDLPGGVTNEMKAAEEKANKATPDTTSKCHIKCEPEENMELHSHPAGKIKEELKMSNEGEAEPSEVAPVQTGRPVNIKQEQPKCGIQSNAACQGYTPYVSSSSVVPTETLQEVDRGHAKEKTQAESEKTTTESGKSAVKECHTPPPPIPPKIEPNSPTETTSGLPGGVTNEIKADEEKANKATPDTTSKCHIKCEPEENMELDSYPVEKIKEEPKMKNEEEAEPSEVAPVQTGRPVNIKQEQPKCGIQSSAACQGYTPYVSSSSVVPTETLQEVDRGHAKEKTQAESEKTTTESGKSAVKECHSTSHTPPPPIPPKIQPNAPTETTGGLPGGVTNEIKADEDKANKATPDTTSKCHIKCEPEENMELDSYPVETIKEEPKMRNEEEEAERSEVAPVQTVTPVNIKQEHLMSIKQEPNGTSLRSLAASPKLEPENRGEETRVPERTETASTQTHNEECKEESNTAVPDKRKASGSSEKEVGSKQWRQICPGDEVEPLMKPSGHQTGMDYRNTTEKALLKDVKPRAQIDKVPASTSRSSSKLWDYIKLKKREPVIGLRKLFECHCEPHAPFYLCTCCRLKIPEKTVVAHITGFEHQKEYLNVPRAYARQAAAEHERQEGVGEAEVVELTRKVYSKIVKQSYKFALEKMQAYRNTLQRSPPASQVVTCKPDTLRPSEAQQPSTSVGLSPTSTTASLTHGAGKTTHVAPKTKVQQTSAPTLKSGATTEVLRNVTSPKSTPSTTNMLTTVSKGVNAAKSVNPLRAVASSKNPAPTADKGRTNHDAGTTRNSTATPHSGNVSHTQPAVPPSPTNGPLLSKPPGEQSIVRTEQGLGSTSPTTPVYGTPTFPPNHTAVVDYSKDKSSSKKQPVLGLDRLVKVVCEERCQCYCLLCSTRMKNRDHMTSNSHTFKYVKFLFPNLEMEEKEMLKMVSRVAKMQKEQKIFKTLEVNAECYKWLATLSPEEALAEVKELVKFRKHSSTSIPEVEGPKCVSGPHGASRSADDHDKRSTRGAQIVATQMAPAPKMDKNKNNGYCEEVAPNPGARPHSLTGVAREAFKPMPEPHRTFPSSARTRLPQISPTTPGKKVSGPSALSTSLKKSYYKTEPVIGLAFVFECHWSQHTFYLCGSCSKMFPIELMCKHIVSSEHQRIYMLNDYPQFMSWWSKDFPPEKKEGLLRDIAFMISTRELNDEMDAQVLLLDKDCYEYIRTAPFSQALDTLQNISRENKLNGHKKQLGPQTSEAPATREPRSADASKQSILRERNLSVGVEVHSFADDAAQLNEPPLCPTRVLQDTVNSGPVVGLRAIVECSCEEQTPFYLCVACGNSLSQGLVLLHVQCPRHLQQYLSARYPWRFEEVEWARSELLQLARELEEQNLDEPGTMQRIPLPLEEFSRIRTMTFDKALSRLRTIYRKQSQSELLTCVASKSRPATKHPFEDGSANPKRRRLSSPPADRTTQTLLKSPSDPRLCSHLTKSEKKVVREAGEPYLLSQDHVHAPQALPRSHVTPPGALSKCLPSLNFDPNPSHPPVSTAGVKPAPIVESVDLLTRTQSVEQAASFPALCPPSLSEGSSQAAAKPLVSLTQKPNKGAVPGARIPLKADNMAADMETFSEVAGYSKDETKCKTKPGPKKSWSKRALNHDTGSHTISYYPTPVQPQVSSSVPSPTNCSAGSFSGPVSHISVIRSASNTSDPHAENTAESGALLPQNDLSFQGHFSLEQTQTGTNQNSSPILLLKEPATTVSSLPIGSTGPLAANLSTMACSSASTQSNGRTHNITEETPGDSRGYSAEQLYYQHSLYNANGYVQGTPSMPPPLYQVPYNPPLYSNMNHTAVGPPNQSLQPPMFGQLVSLGSGQFASQLPMQRQCMVMARGLPRYTSWHSVPPGTNVPLGATASYRGPANYSLLPRAGTYRNNIVISDTQSTSNLREGQPQGVAAFHLSNGTANGTN